MLSSVRPTMAFATLKKTTTTKSAAKRGTTR